MRVNTGVPFLSYHLYINMKKILEGPDKNFRPHFFKILFLSASNVQELSTMSHEIDGLFMKKELYTRLRRQYNGKRFLT